MKKIGMGRKWYNKKLETIKLIATINLLPQNIKFSYHRHLLNCVKRYLAKLSGDFYKNALKDKVF